MIKKINFWLVLFIIFISACKSQNTFLNSLNNNFVDYIKNDSVYGGELKEYLNDNIKHITHLRGKFLKQINRKTIDKANLIENLDKSSYRIYSAVLQIKDSVYTYEYNISEDSSIF